MRMTPQRRARIPNLVREWTAIGAAAGPLDHRAAERAIGEFYRAAGLAAPRVVWAPCPLSAFLSTIVYTAIRATGLEAETRNATYRAAFVERMIRNALIAQVPPAMHDRIQSAVVETVGAALRPRHLTGSGLAADCTICEALCVGFYARRSRWFEPAVEQTLQRLLVAPIRAALRDDWRGLVDPTLSPIENGIKGKTLQAARARFGSTIWIGFAAQQDYRARVLGLPVDRSLLAAIASCGYFWALDDVSFAAERPVFVNRDVAGRLHCEVGPSFSFASGSNRWHWHGVGVPQYVVEDPARITIPAIERMGSPEIRRIMIERYRHGEAADGVAAFLRDAGAIRLDQDPVYGTLWRRDLPGAESILMVEVVNRSPEPDASYKHYVLRVDPQLRPLLPNGGFGLPQEPTARNAVASTFGLPGADYQPEIET